MQAKGYQTGMAAEFYVMHVLYRLGLDASLTLGNRKQVDILVERSGKPPVTIYAKGMQSRTGWLLNRVDATGSDSHFVVLVGFEENFGKPSEQPSCFVVPERDVDSLKTTYESKGKAFYRVDYRKLKDSGYRNAWSLIGRAAL